PVRLPGGEDVLCVRSNLKDRVGKLVKVNSTPSPKWRRHRRHAALSCARAARGAPVIHFPAARRGPLQALSARFLAALLLVVLIALLVWLDRDGYRDNNGDGVSLLDSFYYAVVTLSTTGYGDITPVSDPARAVNVLVI